MFLSDNGGCAEENINRGEQSVSRLDRPTSFTSYGRPLGQRQQYAVPAVQALGARGRHRHAADRLWPGRVQAAGRSRTARPPDRPDGDLRRRGRRRYPKTYKGQAISRSRARACCRSSRASSGGRSGRFLGARGSARSSRFDARFESRGRTHGYAIALYIQSRSEDALRVEEGSLYPALHRMEQASGVKAEWGASENNRRARYYSITA